MIERKVEITLTLFEAIKAVDSYFIKMSLQFDGMELMDELRHKVVGKIYDN